MELRQLKYFLAIADNGSFSAAAERVFVAQSALSHQMAQLEGELGVGLFLRTRRGVALTDAGQRFYPHAVSILRQTDEAAQAARSGSGEPSGKVVFGIPHSVSQALALPLLRAVRQARPATAFVVFSNNASGPYRKRYLGEGASRFLDKSSEFDQLAAAVTQASARVAH